jgi:hypothetical protein
MEAAPASSSAAIDEAQARALVDDIAALLIRDFGYTRKAPRPSGAGRDTSGPGGWVVNFADHDADAGLAMKLLLSGMGDGAVVNFLRENISALPVIDEARRARRLREIRGMVSSARRKIDAQAAADGQAKSGSAAPQIVAPRTFIDDTYAGSNRGRMVAKLAGLLLRRYVDPFVALGICQAFNETRCVEPLAADEVVRIVNAIAAREAERREQGEGAGNGGER